MIVDPHIVQRYPYTKPCDAPLRQEIAYARHGQDGRWQVTAYGEKLEDGSIGPVKWLQYGKPNPSTGGYDVKWKEVVGE
jgi:hypothetical protein